MKIVILVPIYKRPEVWRIAARNLRRFAASACHDIMIVCVLSPEDKHLEENEVTCQAGGFKRLYFTNLPISDKINAGINWILKHMEFDYLMNFGSDDLISPRIFDVYAPYMERKQPLFGINKLYFYELSTGRTLYFSAYQRNGSIGAGRMIHRSIFQAFEDNQMNVYPSGVDSGMDTASAKQIKMLTGVVDLILDTDDHPYIVDIKTPTNINQFMHIEQAVSQYTEVSYKVIKSNFLI